MTPTEGGDTFRTILGLADYFTDERGLDREAAIWSALAVLDMDDDQ